MQYINIMVPAVRRVAKNSEREDSRTEWQQTDVQTAAVYMTNGQKNTLALTGGHSPMSPFWLRAWLLYVSFYSRFCDDAVVSIIQRHSNIIPDVACWMAASVYITDEACNHGVDMTRQRIHRANKCLSNRVYATRFLPFLTRQSAQKLPYADRTAANSCIQLERLK
jgi:hypothetical protein